MIMAPITGVGLVSKTNEIILFIAPTSRTPNRLRSDGEIIRIEDDEGVISAEIYGPLCLSKLHETKHAYVIEVDAEGSHSRGFDLRLEA